MMTKMLHGNEKFEKYTFHELIHAITNRSAKFQLKKFFPKKVMEKKMSATNNSNY